MSSKKLTTAALLTAAALIMFVIEAQIPPLTAVPGIKLGLSNIVTLFALYTMGPGSALCILLVRIFLGSIFLGQMMTLIYSLAGGLLCFCLSALMSRVFPPHKLWVVSVFGAMAHNVGQIATAIWVTNTPELLLYLPILIISGIITGMFTGVTCQTLLRRLIELKSVSYSGKWKTTPYRKNEQQSDYQKQKKLPNEN